MEKLRERIAAYCEENHISGMLRITLKDRVLLEAAFGYADHVAKIPFCAQSMFSLYSLSKPFCAIGLLKLCDAGSVDLDAHPACYLPELKGLDARVTLRCLLHHVSGLFDPEQDMAHFAAAGVSADAALAEFVAALPALPLHFVPEQGKLYANINYNIPALIMERVSGVSYAEYMKREVFEPLGMQSAAVDSEGLEIPHRVKGYEWNGAEMSEVKRATFGMLGAGDIVATVNDVYCLNLAIKHRSLLRESTWEQVLTPSPSITWVWAVRCLTAAHSAGSATTAVIRDFAPCTSSIWPTTLTLFCSPTAALVARVRMFLRSFTLIFMTTASPLVRGSPWMPAISRINKRKGRPKKSWIFEATLLTFFEKSDTISSN